MNSYTITKFTDLSTVSALTFNKPLNLILTALNNILAHVTSISNKSAVIQYLGVLDTDVSIGDLVYYYIDLTGVNPSCFKKAKAQLRGVPGSQGQSVLAASCRVLGLVLSVSPTQILRQGYYNAPAIILLTLGATSAAPGLYYLSPLTLGKATKDPGWNMRQPCISYYGDGKFSLMTNYLAHDSHRHASLIILNTVEWLNNKYTITDASFGLLSKEVTAVFVDGILDTSFDFIDGNTLVYPDLSIQGKTVTVFNHYPFAYGDSVVRAILSKSSCLSLEDNNGVYSIQYNEPTESSMALNSYALADVTSTSKKYTPIVSRIVAGLGITLTRLNDGVYVLASSDIANNKVVATDITCVGAQWSVDSLLSYVTFVKGVESSAIVNIPITYKALSKYLAKFWCVYRGGSSDLLDLSYYWVPNAACVIPTQKLTTHSVALSGADNTLLYLASLLTGFEFTPTLSGTLIIKLTSAGTSAISLYKCGCTLSVVLSAATSLLPGGMSLALVKNIATQVVLDYLQYNTEA